MTTRQTPDAVREASWTGNPHKLAAELRRVASVFDPEKGFRLPQLLRDAADEIDCLTTLGSRAAGPDWAQAGQFLLDRLVDHEVRMTSEADAREWHGHVTPAMARFRAALDSRAGDDLTPRERIARVVAWEHFGIAWHHMEKQSHADVLAMVDRMLDSRAGDAGEPIGALLICDQTGGCMHTSWPVPDYQKLAANHLYGDRGGYRTVPLYAATPAPAVDAVPAGEVGQ